MDHLKAHEKFKNFLKDGKHRVTPERFKVLDAALDYEGHFSADDLFMQMQINKSNISRATVYNTLELLDLCKIITKQNFGQNKAAYEAVIDSKSHDHLICVDCGRIIEFSSDKVKSLVHGICDELGYELSGYSFNIYGKCKKGNDCKFKDTD